ncbi:MAG TPA: UDP-N-acetylmuramate--L-alanine ligase [Acidimicrobiales bacterium]|nr:UDP-N-acetylmuramate--L-alanine ligase [Acidimicrobiales bacterium]
MSHPDLSARRRIHVVGVGGAGMSAIATVLAAMGHQVSGSDLKASLGTEALRARGVRVAIGHDPAHVGEAEMVAVSTAIPPSNPEVVRAGEVGVPVLSRADILAAIVATRRGVAVAGTHGKTTTSSMLTLCLIEAGWRPSFIIGGELNEIGSGAAWSDGEWMVVEADESDGTFLLLPAEAGVVTSVEPDHLEHYGSFEALVDAFHRFLQDKPGAKVACADDPRAAEVGRAAGAVTYGTSAGADYRMTGLEGGRGGTSFRLEHAGESVLEIRLAVPGVHNARNAAAAAVTALLLGVDPAAAGSALARYTGVARRFQFRGESDGVTYVDDYAHLPGEVEPVLATAAAGGWNRVVCVFQPHRYSRTAALWPDFAGAFSAADVVVVTDVYGSGEAPRPGVSGKLVADAVAGAEPGKPVVYLPTRPELVQWLRAELRPGDLCLTLGAGDLTSLPDELMGSPR